MNKTFLFACVLLTSVINSFAQSDEKVLTEINAQFIRNYINNDTINHTKIIHPKFRLLTSSGVWVDRKEYMKGWLKGYTSDIVDYGYGDVSVKIYGDMALVSARTHFTINEGKSQRSGASWYTDVYIREAGKWLCVQAQLTAVK